MVLALFKVLARLPLGVLHAIGGASGLLVYVCSRRYRHRLRDNLAQAGFDVNAMALPAAREAGKQALETAWIWLRSPEDLQRAVRWSDEAVLKRALDDGRAVMILTPHLGCFEAIAQAYAVRPEARARPMTALFRIPRKAILRPLVEGTRAKENLKLAPADVTGVRLLLRALKRREVVGILPDQVPTRGDGVWAPFFGKPAYTMTLPARLAHSANAIALVLGAERFGSGFRIHVEPLAEPLSGDAERDAASINRGIEKMILRFPAQYLWGYNRYKSPEGSKHKPGRATNHVADSA